MDTFEAYCRGLSRKKLEELMRLLCIAYCRFEWEDPSLDVIPFEMGCMEGLALRIYRERFREDPPAPN